MGKGRSGLHGRGKLSTDAEHKVDYVAAYADKIPNTYGAPKREAAAG